MCEKNNSLFLAALAVFLVVLAKASSTLEEKAREHEDDANDAAAGNVMAVGTNSK